MAKKKYRPVVGDLVKVTWDDANTEAGWCARSDLQDLIDGASTECFGLVARYDKAGIILCMSINRDDEDSEWHYGASWFIPRKMITNVKKIAEYIQL